MESKVPPPIAIPQTFWFDTSPRYFCPAMLMLAEKIQNGEIEVRYEIDLPPIGDLVVVSTSTSTSTSTSPKDG